MPPASRDAPASGRPTLAIVGESRLPTAFAMVNARWAAALARRGAVRVRSGGSSGSSRGAASVTVHHDFTQPFGTMPAPPDGHLAAVRPWDFGPYPRAWVQTIVERYDELWVHTEWIRRQAVRSGVPARRVRVVPLGCDPSIFRPDGPRFPVPSTRSVRFLFVGAAVLRKGIDTLLKAWRLAFTRKDDVSLVVKTNPADAFYRGIDWRQRIEELAGDAAAAEVVLIDSLLSPARLASLYRACQATVFPYRAEGFGLPILEAMACGCTPIVPRFGACLDYCDRESAHFVAARRMRLPLDRRLPFNTLGFEEHVPGLDICEIPAERLAATLIRVAALDGRTRRAMARASVVGARGFTWDRSAGAIERAVVDLLGRGMPIRLRRQKARS